MPAEYVKAGVSWKIHDALRRLRMRSQRFLRALGRKLPCTGKSAGIGDLEEPLRGLFEVLFRECYNEKTRWITWLVDM